jgi:hypothetical protein
MSGPLRVDEVASFAHRVDGGVRVVLHLPDVDLGTDEALVRLRAEGAVCRRPATVTTLDGASTLEVVVPAKGLGRRVWQLAVRTDAPSFRRVQARLLTSDRQPIALIPGPVPRTDLAEPPPRRGWLPSGGPVRRAAVRVARAAWRRRPFRTVTG